MHKALHPRNNIDRLYVARKEDGGQHWRAIQELEKQINKSK